MEKTAAVSAGKSAQAVTAATWHDMSAAAFAISEHLQRGSASSWVPCRKSKQLQDGASCGISTGWAQQAFRQGGRRATNAMIEPYTEKVSDSSGNIRWRMTSSS